MDQLKIIEIKRNIYKGKKAQHEQLRKMYGENDSRTRLAFFEMSAAHRDVPEELKPGRQCPGCSRVISTDPNFCASCGKAILYR